MVYNPTEKGNFFLRFNDNNHFYLENTFDISL